MTETAAAPHGDDDTVVQMLCLRIDELERDKEALAAQLDRAEEKLAILKSQADALHRIGSILDLDPGTDLTQEVPARVAALRGERDQAIAMGKGTFEQLRRVEAERATAIQQAVARARRDWAAQGSPWVKARWQAEALETVASISAAEGKPLDADRLRHHAVVMRRQAEGGDHD